MIKDGEKFAYWFRRISKGAVIPVMFIIAAKQAYWLGGIMTVVLLYAYYLERVGVGDSQEEKK